MALKNNELDDDGNSLWNQIGKNDSYEEMSEEDLDMVTAFATERGLTLAPTNAKQKRLISVREKNLIAELRKLMNNSLLVVIDCEKDIAYFTEREEYFKANQAKVAAHCHRNFARRLGTIIKTGKLVIEEVSLDNPDRIEPSDSIVK